MPAWGFWRSLLVLSPVLIGGPLVTLRHHYTLPPAVTDAVDVVTGLPQLSEPLVLETARYLSEDVGYRTVGTVEHAEGEAWLLERVKELQTQCQQVVAQHPGRKLECEIWRQQGNGSHRFDMMHKRLYKTYVNLSNVIVRVSDGTDSGKEHAVLVNSHLDSTLPSPGAADDAIAVGIMLECLRVLIHTPDWSPEHAIIFLFNNAEESLQDGSHLYSTQHITAPSVRAVINLEAAGTTGRELLFQATSEQMIEAYSHVPRPMGTIVAANIFDTGIMLSDTDFRQFVEYLNVTGLDIAIVSNSYLYHMRKDVVENIQPGVAQHMGENTLALLRHLSSTSSALPSLAAGYSKPSTVYFSYLWFFFLYSADTARTMYTALLALSFVFVRLTFVDPAPALRRRDGMTAELLRGSAAVLLGTGGAVVGANLVAVLMQHVLGKALSWFSVEFACIALYGPAALAGALGSQLLIGPVRERAVLDALLILQAFAALAIQLAGIGSAAMFAISAAPLLVGLALNVLIGARDVSLWTYALGQVSPLLTGAQFAAITLDVFVPLTGRIGADAPGENIIASIVAMSGAFTLPLVLPFAHRFGRAHVRRAALAATVATAAAVAVFAMREPFDEMHQKRLFVIHMENTTSMEQHLHFAAADAAPGFGVLADDIVSQFGLPGATTQQIVMDDWNGDWDVIYPFSAFLTPHKFAMQADDKAISALAAGDKIRITAVDDVVDVVAGTRSFTLTIYHPGVIWTSIAFDAHVLEWSLDGNPPDETARHHIKEASYYGEHTWSVRLVVRGEGPLRVTHVGIRESTMWPAKRRVKEAGGATMELFERLDGWLEERTGGTVDAMMLGCIGGVTEV